MDTAETFAARVREELARRRMTRLHLADLARISLSTLEKALSGERSLTLATRLRVEEALGLSDHRSEQPAGSQAGAEVAPPGLGAYSRAAVSWIEGEYLTLRPGFETEGSIYAYRTTISWDDTTAHLVFSESDRSDAAYAQRGSVSMPHQSGHIYLVTNELGQHRLGILARPTIDGALYGLLTTLQARRGSQLVPISVPLALVPMQRAPNAALGSVYPGEEAHRQYGAYLERVRDEEFARFPM